MSINKNIKLLLLWWNLRYLGEWMFGPLFAIFAEKVGGDILDITRARSIYLIISGIMYIVVGRLIDKYDNKEIVMVSWYALNALCTFLYLFVSSPRHLFVVQAWLGIAAAMATPTRDALFSKYENKKKSGSQRWLAWWSAEIVTWIAIVIWGYIVSYFSFNVLFITMGIIQIIATIYQAQILRSCKSH